MKMYDLHKGHVNLPETGPDFKIPSNQNIISPDLGNTLNEAAGKPSQVKNSIKQIDWGKWILTVGAIFGAGWIFDEIMKNKGHVSDFRKRRLSKN